MNAFRFLAAIALSSVAAVAAAPAPAAPAASAPAAAAWSALEEQEIRAPLSPQRFTTVTDGDGSFPELITGMSGKVAIVPPTGQ